MSTKFKHSLAFKLSASVLSIIFFTFLLLLSYNYFSTRGVILKNLDVWTMHLLESANYDIQREFISLEQIAQDIANALESFQDDQITEKSINNFLKRIIKDNDPVSSATIAYEPFMFNKDRCYFAPSWYQEDDGSIKYWSECETSAYNYFERNWYAIPKANKKGTWTDLSYDDGLFNFSLPFYKNETGDKKLTGIINLEIKIGWLNNILVQTSVYETGSAFILARNGDCITRKRMFNLFTLAKENNNNEMKKAVERIIKTQEGSERSWSPYYNKICYIRYLSLKNQDLILGIIIPEDELFYELKHRTIRLFLISLLGYLFTMIFIIASSNKIMKPLNILVEATNKIGKGNFNASLPSINAKDEIGALSESFQVMRTNLIKYIADVREITASKEKIENELKVASEIQQSMIPQNFPQLKTCDMYAMIVPAKEVGGDFYDFFFIDEDHLCFAIGDVSGKGIPAALFMAIARTLLRAKINSSKNLTYAINSMNEDLCKENDSLMFLTLFIGILNVVTGELEFCNAGHCPPAFCSKGKSFNYIMPEKVSPFIGVTSFDYKTTSMKINPGGILFSYTDGITEAINTAKDLFTMHRLIQVLENNKDKHIKALIDSVYGSITFYQSGIAQNDDITMLAIKYNGK